MRLFVEHLFLLACLLGLFKLSTSGGTNYDPHRWLLTYGKAVTQSSTQGAHEVKYATDGDFRNVQPPMNYTETALSTKPYLQIDLGKNMVVSFVHINVPITEEFDSSYNNLVLSVGEDSAVDSTTNWKRSFKVAQFYRAYIGQKSARYITIKSVADTDAVIRVSEVSVFNIPIENAAFRKKLSYSSGPGDSSLILLTDGDQATSFATNHEEKPWLRIDLEATHSIHEVLLFAEWSCCSGQQLVNFELRIGESLENNGNNNPLCFFGTVWTGELRSIYCDMLGRYVNLMRIDTYIQLVEVIINPETTENVAARKTAYASTTSINIYTNGKTLTDLLVNKCYISKTMDTIKRVWVILGANYNIAMIHIVTAKGNKHCNDEPKDFKIGVGMENNHYAQSVLCVPGYQSMTGIDAFSFFCEPGRITGNIVHIFRTVQNRVQLCLCEIAVYEETKPKIMDLATNRYVWSKLGEDITLDCDAKGYPAPVVSWVKNNVVINSGSSSLQLSNLKSDDLGMYECWANNTHGFEARLYEVKSASELRVCVGSTEIKYEVDKSINSEQMKLKGDQWYKFCDQKQFRELQFRQAVPVNSVPSCDTWMKGSHPRFNDGAVARTLCIKNETHDCSTKYEIYVRGCAHYFVYNFRKLIDLNGLNLCLKNAKSKDKFAPVMTSATRHHALSGSTFHTEENLQESYECLMLCQLDKKCKSFNFSQKLQICELNSGTKKESPGNFASSLDFDYYQLGRGVLKAAHQEL